jgi:hypothetical protein
MAINRRRSFCGGDSARRQAFRINHLQTAPNSLSQTAPTCPAFPFKSENELDFARLVKMSQGPLSLDRHRRMVSGVVFFTDDLASQFCVR